MRRLAALVMFVVLCLAAAVVLLNLCVIAWASQYTYEGAVSLPHEQAALVLGASVYSNGDLSTVLAERADAALALYRAGVVSKILVSGDNSSLDHNEVYPVGKYLINRGVPEQDIFLDYAGFDTYSSMYRAKHIFGVSSMIIASQRFHLPRALLLARASGIDAVGYEAAPARRYFFNALRELPATIKALGDLLLARQPRYLGSQYFIEGDGSVTWVGPKAEKRYFSQ